MNTDTEKKTLVLPSYSKEDWGIAEMVYDRKTSKTAFVAKKMESEEIYNLDSLDFPDLVVKPLSGDDPMLRLNFLRFASAASPYEDNRKLFGMVKHYIEKYMALPPDFLTVAAVYVMFTWLYDRFTVIPYLRVLGNFGTGKTRFLTLIGNLSYKAMFFGGATSTAGVFRTLDWISGTMMFDETDFRDSNMWVDIIKILNAGHDKNFPVIKTEPSKDGKFTIRAFNVFAPKVLSSRNRFGDQALESRCLTAVLYPVKDSKFPTVLPDDSAGMALNIRNFLLMFRFLNYDKVSAAEVSLPDIVTPRIRQTLTAVVQVAKLIGDDIVDEIVKFGVKADKELRAQIRNSPEVDMLICIVEIVRGKDVAFSKKIYMLDLAQRYHLKYYAEYNDRTERHSRDDNNELMVNPNYQVSARKVGSIIDKLGLKKQRDGRGFYIPSTEYPKVLELSEYFGLTDAMLKLSDEPRESEEELSDVEALPLPEAS